MSKTTLRWLAVILTVLIVVVGIGAFDRLPRALRKQIEAERTALKSAQTRLEKARAEVSHTVQSDPDLFRSLPFSGLSSARLDQASGALQSASRDMETLTRLEKSGHRSDRQRAETLLASERGLRESGQNQFTAVQKEAAQYAERKRHLPEELQAAEQNYRAIRAFNLAPVTSAVQKAESDWPAKKTDLEARVGALAGIVAACDGQWQAANAAQGNAGALLAASDALRVSAAELPKKAEELQNLTAQLYTSWDKMLVDMEARGSGNARAYNQKIRTVRTAQGTTTSDERWIDVSRAQYEAMRNNLGMAVEHKSAGKYEFEAERVAQPAGFAYMAPPGQRNQYGYWERRDGRDFWIFYGQYALMRDLLFNHGYRPLDRYEWEGYRTYQNRGQTYYGQGANSAPRYGTNGTATQERYSGSTYGKSGGFRDSQYASKGGSYSDSKYASPGGDRTPKTFGRGKPDEPHTASPPPRPSYRPAPSRPSPSGGGRSYGSGGRRRK